MRAILVLLLLLSACAGTPACPLETVADLPLEMIHSVPVVTAEINGRPASLILDTGSDATVLTRAAARRLGVAEGAETRTVGAAGGRTPVGAGRLDSLALGTFRATGRRVLLADSPRPPLDGVLGIDTLVEFELDLDVPRRRATFYRARRCLDARPGWAGASIRLPVRQQPGSGHLFVPVEVDGERMSGLLDTGASSTALSLQAAEDIRVGRKRLARLPAGFSQALNAQGVMRRELQARTLKIGPDTLERPMLSVVDLPPFTGDVLIGEDYLGTRRLWFSFRLGRVWVAESSGVTR